MDHIGQFVTKEQLIEKVNANSRIDPHCMYVLKFQRSVPKCTRCGRKSKKWARGVDEVCSCGGTIEYDKTVEAKIRSMGTERFMYFENGITMKQCLTDNIKSVTMPISFSEVVELFLVNC